MTKVFIHQPDFAPWINFFYRINFSDIYVVLDNVQFNRRGWFNRDYIKIASGKEIITIPVIKKDRLNTLVNQIEISYEHRWIDKLLKSLELNYKKSINFESSFVFFENLFKEREKYLINLNLKIIYFVLKNLYIRKKIIFSSDLKLNQQKADKILEICKQLKASEYITGEGSKEYLDYNKFHKQNIKIRDNLFFKKKYKQQHGEFIPNLSIIDFLFNVNNFEKKYF